MLSSASKKSSLRLKDEEIPQTSSIKKKINTNKIYIKFCYDESHIIPVPLNTIYNDLICVKPLRKINLNGWDMRHASTKYELFDCMKKTHFETLEYLSLDHCIGLTLEDVATIRGFIALKTLSLVSLGELTGFGAVLASFKLLITLNLSECSFLNETIGASLFLTISESLSSMKTIILIKCKGVTNSHLHSLGKCMQRFRCLEKVDLSYSTSDFGDNGLIDMMTAGYNIINSVKIAHCGNHSSGKGIDQPLSSLCLAGLRNNMSNLTELDINSVCSYGTIAPGGLSQSAFEWISEGCKNVTDLNISNSPNVDNVALLKIGKQCKHLSRFNIARCPVITDQGIIDFMSVFVGSLQFLDMTGNVGCGSASIFAICQNKNTSVSIEEIKLNGLSKVSAQALVSLWGVSSKLSKFEMACELSSSTTERKSLMPHFSDAVLLSNMACMNSLRELVLTGCCLLSDTGCCSLVNKCLFLQKLDLSSCTAITNKTLIKISTTLRQMKSLSVNGCTKIDNEGLIALCNGIYTSKTLIYLSLNGCSWLTDVGISSIANLTQLESLWLRCCDQVSEEPIIKIAKGCSKLREIDISSLDLVGVRAVTALVSYCSSLVHLTCESCSITPKEYQECVKNKLIWSKQFIGKCRLQMQSKPIRVYNKYIIDMQEKNEKAFIIFRFIRYVSQTAWLRYRMKVKPKIMKKLSRIFNALKKEVRDGKRSRSVHNQGACATHLQKCMKRLFAVRLARLKARTMRRNRFACITLQRLFRGYACRIRILWRFKLYFISLFKFKAIVHKLMLLTSAKELHQRILVAQAFGKMIAGKFQFRRMKQGFTLLQRRFRAYFEKVKVQLIQDEEEAKRQIELNNLNLAASKIQINIKNSLFNKHMSKYILICCIYYRNQYDEQKWHSTILQKRWRGFMVRLKIRRRKRYEQLKHSSALRVQSLVRRFLARGKYLVYRDKMRIVFQRWIKLTRGHAMPRLRLGDNIKPMQRALRQFIFLRDREYASIEIQRVYRGHVHRLLYKEKYYLTLVDYVNKIKYNYRIYKARKMRFFMKARQHMAVYKIEQKALKFFTEKRIQKSHAFRKQVQRDMTVAKKSKLAVIRREKIVEKIRYEAKIKNIIRIQKRFRIWVEMVHKRQKDDEARIQAELLKAALNEGQNDKKSILNGVTIRSDPFKPIRRVMGMLFGSTEDINERDRDLIKNAVLKYQVKNIVQEGIIDIHITVGEIDNKSFHIVQNTYKIANLPHFIKIDNDLSGGLDLKLYLWVLFGTGLDCITQLIFQPKLETVSNERMKIQAVEDQLKGIKTAWNEKLHFYIQGICSIKQGKGDFAIQGVKITETIEAAHQLMEANESITDGSDFFLVADMAKFGFVGTNIWCSAIKPPSQEDEESLFKLGKLPAMKWSDERLIKIVKSYNLSESEVYAIRAVYDEIIGGRSKTILQVEEIFIHLDFPFSQIAKWVFEGINPATKTHLKFSEYVHMICFYVMFSGKDVAKFLFGCIDTENKNYIRRDQFNELLSYLAENSPFNVKVWELQYEQYHDKKLKFMFFNNFQSFINSNPSALWQAQLLQRKLAKVNLGAAYWDKKMEQFRLVREQLGITQFK